MKDKKVILYIVLSILILFTITGLVYAKVNYKDDSKQKTVTEEPANSKKYILELIDIMTVKDALEPVYGGTTYTMDNISYKYIMKSTLNSINNNKTFTPEELRTTTARMKKCINAGYYTEDYLLKYIHKVYGNITMNYKTDLGNTGFIYDSVNKNFYELCTNKIESNNFIDTYVYDYKEEGDKAYVYVSVAYGTETPVMVNGGATDKTVINIYRTSKRDTAYKSYVSDPEHPDEFTLGKDNYNDFSKFKYTFTKEDGEFHFTEIKLINNDEA